MTYEDIKGIVERTIADIMHRYPKRTPPAVRFVPLDGPQAAFVNSENQLEVDPTDLVDNPLVTEKDVRWLVAHEMGHWRQYTGRNRALIQRDRDERQDLQFRMWIGEVSDQQQLDVVYRQLPLEADADQFANRFIGDPNFDVLDQIRRFDEGSKRRAA